MFQFFGEFKERINPNVDGPAVVHNPEGPANKQDKSYDVGLIDKTIKKGRKDFPCLGLVFDITEGFAFYDFAFGFANQYSMPFKLPTRKYPGKHSRKYNDGKYNDVSVRDFSFSKHRK